jgi:uncharacterized protein YjbI with pentapeptide repeats
MKVIKPMKLGVLMRTYELERRPRFVVSVLAMFPFASPTRLFPEAEMWKFAAEALGKTPVLDEGMPKPRGEVLVTGSAFNLGGPKPSGAVRVKIEGVEKTLSVTGDRVWPYDAGSGKPAGKPTDPVPFDEMPVDWEHAYGGEGYAKNPLGRGYWTKKTLEGKAVPLPNVEDPQRPVTRPDTQPEPAGFGPYDFSWPQRFSKVGTYDERWLKEQLPGFALDMDPGLFNTAPDGQQIKGFFRGDEPFEIDGMHREKARLSGTLPRLAGRAFVKLRTKDGEELREVPLRLDTVRLFPAAERGLVIFRGVVEVAEDDADDVLVVMIAAEKLDAERLPTSHYEAVLANRLDRKKAAAHAQRDRDLVPDPDPDAPRVDGPPEDDLAAAYKPELLQMAAMKRRMANEFAGMQERIKAIGLDPADWAAEMPPEEEPVPDDPVERAEYQERMIAKAEAAAAEGKAQAEARAREECAKVGLDYDEVVARVRDEGGGPPKFSAQEEITRMRCLAELSRIGGIGNAELDARADDPALVAKLVAMEVQLRETYRGLAHHFPSAPLAPEARSREVREEATLEPRPSFAGRDLTGVDLSGLDLAGCDFAGALLERANLAGSDLAGAKLAGAVLARAKLGGANLAGADLTRANLGSADLTGASLKGATLVRAILAKATLARADLEGASLDDADLSEATFGGTSFARARGARLTFTGAKLAGVRFDEADLPRCRFVDCSLAGASFVSARLPAATFMTVEAVGAVFDGAHLDGLRVVQVCDFSKASFKRASLVRANLREAVLEGADFEGATLSNADLSKARLAGANLHRALARDARFDRADLSGANMTGVDCLMGSLHRAVLCGADLRGSSFFGADFLRIVVDKGTRLDGAVLGRVRYVPGPAPSPGRPPSGS